MDDLRKMFQRAQYGIDYSAPEDSHQRLTANVYSFYIGQLTDECLLSITQQCREHINGAGGFWGVVGNAMLDEIQRRKINPDGPATELSIPWVHGYKLHYKFACYGCVTAMQKAHEEQNFMLRDFWDLCREILYDQATQPTTKRPFTLHTTTSSRLSRATLI